MSVHVEPKLKKDVKPAATAGAGEVPPRAARSGHRRIVRVALLGYGRVGQAVARLAAEEGDRLAAAGLDVSCVGALVRDPRKPRDAPAVPLTVDPATIVRDADVVVEVLGGMEPALAIATDVLRTGRPVVTANKTLVAAHGRALAGIASSNGTVFACEAAVLAGVPFVGSLSRRPLVSAARRIEGVLNGTSHVVVQAIARGVPLDRAVAAAVTAGYAEPDSAADTSGRDAAEKLAILLHLAGCPDVAAGDLRRTDLAVLRHEDCAGAARLDGTIKPVALAALDGPGPGAWVGPAFVERGHPFAELHGVANALRLTGRQGLTVSFAGPGAGPEATAVTILDDVVEAVTGRSGVPRALPVDAPSIDAARLRRPPAGPWFLAIGDAENAEWPAEALDVLSSRGVRARRAAADARQVHVVTAPVTWDAVHDAIWAFHARGTRVLAVPALLADAAPRGASLV